MLIGLTGATGFIGGAVAREASEAGHSVVGFSRRSGVQVGGCEEYRVISQDGTGDFSGLDAVVHLSGESIIGLWTASKRKAILDSRIISTQNIVEQLARLDPRPKTLLCASAIGIYGERGDELLSESEPTAPGFLAEVTKAWENAAAAAEEHGIRVVSPRIGMVLGKGGGVARILKKVFGFGLGGKLGNGRQWMSWVHVVDAARFIVFALGNEAVRGPVNLVTPNPIRNTEFSREVARVLRRPAIAPAPAFAMRLLLREFSGVFLDSVRVNPELAVEHGFSFKYPELGPAVEETFS
jgi:uncharacterized protein (TIGR01777 family)